MMASGESAIAVAKGVKSNWGSIVRSYKWVRDRVYPKPPRNSIGFAIGIEILDETCRGQIDEDFIRTVEELIERSQAQKPIKLVRIPEPLIKRIKVVSDIIKTLEKCDCVFLIYGKARVRKIDGKSHFVLDLGAGVRHDEIEIERSLILRNEMLSLLPSRRTISGDNDLTEFETNAENIHLAALYIIATAVFLSGEIDLSIELFTKLQRKLTEEQQKDNLKEVDESIRYLRKNTVTNLCIVHLEKAAYFQGKWRRSRNQNDLDKMMLHVNESRLFIRESYSAAMLSSLYYFVTDRDTKRARKVIVPWRMKGIDDATWAFDEAFFYAYEGKLKDAHRYYEKGFKRATSSSLLVEIEEFLLWILSEEPDKVQFYFCLGMINLFGKGDLVTARKDFEKFLESTALSGDFPEHREMTTHYLMEIGTKG